MLTAVVTQRRETANGDIGREKRYGKGMPIPLSSYLRLVPSCPRGIFESALQAWGVSGAKGVEMTDHTICPVCESPVEQTGTGRPAIFCCPGCKLQRQHTVRRLQTRVAALEDELRLSRTLHKRGLLLVDCYFRQPLEQLEDLTADLEHAQARLRALLVSAEEA